MKPLGLDKKILTSLFPLKTSILKRPLTPSSSPEKLAIMNRQACWGSEKNIISYGNNGFSDSTIFSYKQVLDEINNLLVINFWAFHQTSIKL